MHGRRKKDVVEPTPEEKEKQREQVRTASALFKKLLALRQAETYSQQTMEMTFKALQFHPEFPTLWGYRRELILQSTPAQTTGDDGNVASEGSSSSAKVEPSRREVLEMEMKLLEKALRKSQKVYSIWFHRKWTIERLLETCGHDDVAARSILDTELELCGRLHEVDERNFHCWNHRAHVLGLMRRRQAAKQTAIRNEIANSEQGAPVPDGKGAGQSGYGAVASPAATETPEDASSEPAATASTESAAEAKPSSFEPSDFMELDLKLSKDLVNRNFSNYSAWHLRALVQQDAGSEQPVDVDQELEWVQQGIYTEPNDQSVWLYHHWLTALGRGRERNRITHCAVLDGELFAFFSSPTCVAVSSSHPAVATVRKGAEGDEPVVVHGHLTPVAPDCCADAADARRQTRQLPRSRRRWALAWRFVADATASSFDFRAEGFEIELSITVENVGSTVDGTPELRNETLSFLGPPTFCDLDDSTLASALSAIIGPIPDSARGTLLQTEVERIEELLEIEPDCKWALLALGRLKTVVAAGAGVKEVEAVEKSCSDGYTRMCALDPLRRGFYEDARAKSALRLRVLAWLAGDGGKVAGLARPLDLCDLGLRNLAPATLLPAFGIRVLVVEGNHLHELGPILLLASLHELRAARNRLVGEATVAFALPKLRILDLSSNSLSLGGQGVARPMPICLEFVDLSGNSAVLSLASSAQQSTGELLGQLLPGASEASWDVDVAPSEGRCRFRVRTSST